VESLNRRACRCPGNGGAVLPEVAFLAKIVAPTITFHTRAGAPPVGASTYIALHPTLLRWKAPRPLRLMVRLIGAEYKTWL